MLLILKGCVCVCVSGALRGQSDASAEVHQSLEESSPAATVPPAGLHEDAGEGRTSAHVQAEGGLDRTVQVSHWREAEESGCCVCLPV